MLHIGTAMISKCDTCNKHCGA